MADEKPPVAPKTVSIENADAAAQQDLGPAAEKHLSTLPADQQANMRNVLNYIALMGTPEYQETERKAREQATPYSDPAQRARANEYINEMLSYVESHPAFPAVTEDYVPAADSTPDEIIKGMKDKAREEEAPKK